MHYFCHAYAGCQVFTQQFGVVTLMNLNEST